MAETRTEQLTRQSRVLRKLAPYTVTEADLALGAVTVSWTRADATSRTLGADRLMSIHVRRGREQPGEQPAPGTLTFSFSPESPAELDELAPGTAVWFQTRPAFDRYLLDVPTGPYDVNAYKNACQAFVTDATLTYVPQADGPPAPVVNVTAQGARARGAQARIGGAPWPEQTVAARASKIVAETRMALLTAEGDHTDASRNWLGFAEGVVGIGSGYLVRGKDVDRQAPDGLLDALANDVGAVWGESLHRPQQIVWQALDGRGDRDPLVELTADEVARTATWDRRLSGTVNRYTVEAGADGSRTTATVEDAASVTALGEFAVGRETDLLNLADAERLAALIVGRNSRPAWSVNRLDVDLLDLKLPRAKAALLLLRGEMGSLISVTGMPTTAPTARYFILEGTELSVTRHDARLTVYVSDAARTAAPMTWAEVPAALTWADLDPAMTWLQAAGWFEPPPLVYRWADVPVDQRWRDLEANETRDAGDGRVPTWDSYPNDP